MLSSVTLSILSGSVLLLVPRGSAQQTNATCLPSFGWANNSIPQSPCLVAAYLQGACNNGDFNMQALPAGKLYSPPTANNTNACQCSTVTYSMISACAACQNRSYDTWSSWDTNCSNTYLLTYPEDIPSGTRVPGWAYLDVTVGDRFDAAAAQRDSGAPESTMSAKPTGTIFTTPAPASSISSSSSSSSSSASPSATMSSSKSSHAGAIAGGVVGGVIFLGLISGLAFLYRVRQRSGSQPTPASYGAFDTHGPSSVGAIAMPTILSSPPRYHSSSNLVPLPSSQMAATDIYTMSAHQRSTTNHQTSTGIRHEELPEI